MPSIKSLLITLFVTGSLAAPLVARFDSHDTKVGTVITPLQNGSETVGELAELQARGEEADLDDEVVPRDIREEYLGEAEGGELSRRNENFEEDEVENVISARANKNEKAIKNVEKQKKIDQAELAAINKQLKAQKKTSAKEVDRAEDRIADARKAVKAAKTDKARTAATNVQNNDIKRLNQIKKENEVERAQLLAGKNRETKEIAAGNRELKRLRNGGRVVDVPDTRPLVETSPIPVRKTDNIYIPADPYLPLGAY
ncbi:uncharacterized protein CTRU02_212447 [Colletotrichum truncatum]|uniref:Uncharacterized protein n=1 Tax=Colletotrichum truncatum TaxID=5467 RepID=A0ACC3YNK0_COLTU|nr:uncharacterized protein CTRU02_08683 [Colletotrichum truncatum]KAF6789436.1 hypothetical protein CTRU02_08683 [Colletotrichum truncatum]